MPPHEPSDVAALSRPTSIRRNKPRLYLLFYAGGLGETKFHPVLALAPKKPDPSKVQTWRFHLKRVGRDGSGWWSYEGSQVSNYDQRMVAAVLVCKLDPDITGMGLAGLLKEVQIPEDADDSTSRQWVCSALKLLMERKVMPPLPLLPQAIYDRGHTFAENVSDVESTRVPTCDFTGTKMKAEIARI